MGVLAPVPALAASPDRAPEEGSPTVSLTDSNGDTITDGLQALMDDADPVDSIEVVVVLGDETAAGRSEQSLPDQALRYRYQLIPAFSAGLNKGQIIALSKQPGVVRVEEDFTVSISNNGASADFGTALARTNYGVDGTGVGICVTDTGLDPGHEQLDDVGKIAGWFDSINGSATPNDGHGHGTHVAATAAGSGTGGANAALYQGAAPGATLYGAKVLDNSGFSVGSSIAQGVDWCAAQTGVDIISMSLGSDTPSDGLDSLSLTVNAAVDAGKIVVIAAGNAGDGKSSIGSPGAAEKAITVGAVAGWSLPVAASNHSDGVYLASFTSRGPILATPSYIKPDISAPGVSITSAEAGSTGDYDTSSGTSMATPFVAGAVALMLDADGTLTDADVKSILSATSKDRGPAGKDNDWGWGLIDGLAVVAEASADASYTPTPFPTYTSISGSVADNGLWQYAFDLTAADLNIPIAATILIDGELVCTLDIGPLGCFRWEWDPDLDARLLDPSSTEIATSTCVVGSCGFIGRQETLDAMPTTAGTYTIEVFPWEGTETGGDFDVYLSRGPLDPPPPSVPLAEISISKSANQIVASGGTATFTIRVENTGDVNLLNTAVADVLVADCARDILEVRELWNGKVAVGWLLKPGESFSYTCTEPGVTGGFVNSATASASTSASGVPVEDTATAAVEVADIDITKTVTSGLPVPNGSVVSFQITVVNTGEVNLLDTAVTDVLVSDCARDNLEVRALSNGKVAVGWLLKPGESFSYTCADTVTGAFTNVAGVSATASGIPVSDSDSAVVTVVNPAITVEKTPDLQPSSAAVSFTITVTNTGDVNLLNTAVADAASPVCTRDVAAVRLLSNGKVAVGWLLKVGESFTYVCDVGVAAGFVNTAIASAWWQGHMVDDSDTATVQP